MKPVVVFQDPKSLANSPVGREIQRGDEEDVDQLISPVTVKKKK